MSSNNLDNLVKSKLLKIEPPDHQEFTDLIQSGKARLIDSNNSTLSIESRFDLAYNAAHALALAALRWHGYRPDKQRYIVFQVLPATLGLQIEESRILATCHNRRNIAEYQGDLDIDDKLLKELVSIANTMLCKLLSLPISR